MMKRAYYLHQEILDFCEKYGRELPEFSDPEFAFLVDMLNHSNGLSTKLLGSGQLIRSVTFHGHVYFKRQHVVIAEPGSSRDPGFIISTSVTVD